MCGGIHNWGAEGLVPRETGSCSRGASCEVEYTMGRLRDLSLKICGLVAEVHKMYKYSSGGSVTGIRRQTVFELHSHHPSCTPQFISATVTMLQKEDTGHCSLVALINHSGGS